MTTNAVLVKGNAAKETNRPKREHAAKATVKEGSHPKHEHAVKVTEREESHLKRACVVTATEKGVNHPRPVAAAKGIATEAIRPRHALDERASVPQTAFGHKRNARQHCIA